MARDEEALADRARVEPSEQRCDHVTLTPGKRVDTAYTSSTFNSVRVAGGNTIIELSATVSYHGTFTGTSIVEGTLIVHADANFHDVESFTGTVNGVPGTATFNLTGSNDSSLALHATATITGATGDLAGLHGVLHEVGSVHIPTGPFCTYSGQIG